jgi:hypothetical protein
MGIINEILSIKHFDANQCYFEEYYFNGKSYKHVKNMNLGNCFFNNCFQHTNVAVRLQYF